MLDVLLAYFCMWMMEKPRNQTHHLGGEPDDIIPSVHPSLALLEFHCVSSSLLPFLQSATCSVCIVFQDHALAEVQTL